VLGSAPVWRITLCEGGRAASRVGRRVGAGATTSIRGRRVRRLLSGPAPGNSYVCNVSSGSEFAAGRRRPATPEAAAAAVAAHMRPLWHRPGRRPYRARHSRRRPLSRARSGARRFPAVWWPRHVSLVAQCTSRSIDSAPGHVACRRRACSTVNYCQQLVHSCSRLLDGPSAPTGSKS
jgi:hypothetical protein